MKQGTQSVRKRRVHIDPPSEESRAFVRGFAAAVAEVAATFDQPTMARSLLDGVGIRPAHLWDANVDKPDLKVLEKLFGSRSRK